MSESSSASCQQGSVIRKNKQNMSQKILEEILTLIKIIVKAREGQTSRMEVKQKSVIQDLIKIVSIISLVNTQYNDNNI